MGLKAGACYGLALVFCPCHFPLILLVLFAAAGATGWWAGSLLFGVVLSVVLSGGFALAGFLLSRRQWQADFDGVAGSAVSRLTPQGGFESGPES